MIILKNGMSSASQIGYLAKVSTKDGNFELAGVGDIPIGVISESVSPTQPCRIITDGEALVYMHKKATVGNYIRHHGVDDGAPKGSCVPVNGGVGPMVIGKALETGSGLIRVSVNMNDTSELSLTDVQWDDLRAPATAINPPGQASDPDWDNTEGGWLFASSGTEQIWIILQMPHGWKIGSEISPHLHWEPTNVNTGNVLWRISYKWTNIDDTRAAGFTDLDVLSAGRGTTGQHTLAEFGVIDGGGKTMSSILTILLQRIGSDGSDTYTADALLKEFDIHYQIDSPGGSREEYTK